MKKEKNTASYITPKTKIIISMILWGTIGIFVRGIDLSSLEIAFFTAVLGSGFLILISLINKDRINMDILKQNILISAYMSERNPS